jgi:hypothetical protein
VHINENGGFTRRAFGHYNPFNNLPGGIAADTQLVQIDVDYMNSYLLICGERSRVPFWGRALTSSLVFDIAFRSVGWLWNNDGGFNVQGCRFVPGTIRANENSAFVMWGDTPYDSW